MRCTDKFLIYAVNEFIHFHSPWYWNVILSNLFPVRQKDWRDWRFRFDIQSRRTDKQLMNHLNNRYDTEWFGQQIRYWIIWTTDTVMLTFVFLKLHENKRPLFRVRMKWNHISISYYLFFFSCIFFLSFLFFFFFFFFFVFFNETENQIL